MLLLFCSVCLSLFCSPLSVLLLFYLSRYIYLGSFIFTSDIGTEFQYHKYSVFGKQSRITHMHACTRLYFPLTKAPTCFFLKTTGLIYVCFLSHKCKVKFPNKCRCRNISLYKFIDFRPKKSSYFNILHLSQNNTGRHFINSNITTSRVTVPLQLFQYLPKSQSSSSSGQANGTGGGNETSSNSSFLEGVGVVFLAR